MCGIFGYIGKGDVVQTTLKGLKRLEYRGYDSSGIAGLKGNELLYVKERGKIQEIEKLIALKNLKLDSAIAHTRWATHGKPSEVNAHPHISDDKSLAVVHNGIIENHTALRNMLEGKGFHFRSDTDTEVIAHLISSLYKGDLLKAVQEALPILKGAWALAVIHKDHPDTIIVAMNQCPMVIGIGKEEMFVASDVHAFNGQASKAVFLANGEVAEVTRAGFKLFDASMTPINKELRTLAGLAEEVTREGYEHYTLKEIFEQPLVIRSALSSRCIDEYGTAHFDSLTIEPSFLQGVKRIMIIACGTSYHAGFSASYLFEEMVRIPTQVEISSEFRYKNPIVPEGTLAIAISQSGETADTLAALRELKAKGAPVLAICNVMESSIAREADSCLYLRAGPEIGVCSTKAFTSQVVVLSLFALMMARMRDLSREEGKRFLNHLQRLPEEVEEILKRSSEVEKLAKKYAHYENFFFLGRRYMFPCALEGALKLKEISYINANAYAAGEMKHGPISLITSDCPTVAFLSDKKTYEKMLSNVMEVRARSGPVIAVAEEKTKELSNMVDDLFLVPKTVDELAVIPATIFSQLFAYYVAKERGAEIDQPRNLAKSVTVE